MTEDMTEDHDPVPTCNVETLGKGFCGEVAIWKGDRWPTGTFCQKHKDTLAGVFKTDWVKINE